MKKGFWTLRYTLINIFYFAAFCTVHGYATVFLLYKNFTNTEVGIALALANILSVIGQPFVAGIVDRYKKVTNRKVLILGAFVMLLGSLGLVLVKDFKPVIFFCYVLIYTVQFISMSILIALSFEYRAAGCNHNFGLARGLGSASFAITSAIMGKIIVSKGPVINMYLTIILMAVLMVLAFSLKMPKDAVLPKEVKEKPNNNFFEFVKTYPMFMLFLLGASCCFFSHNMLNDYLIQIIRRLGGNETQLGYASFLQAILELPVMALIVYVLKKVKAKHVLVFSSVAFFAKIVIMYFATGLGTMYVSQSIQLFAYAVFIPTAAYYSDSVMKENDKVKGQAYINCATTLGGVFSNLACGPVLDKKGVPSMLIMGIIVCFVGVIISAASMYLGKKKEHA